jgi:glycerophosphoryl diester phosphodiesterase
MKARRAPWLTEYAYAHRGLWRVKGPPENSLAAFDDAHHAGLGIELDVRISADGEAMVFHDATLDRMTRAKGYMNGYTARELGQLHLLGGEEHLPTLSEALDFLPDTPMLIELKVNYGSEGPLERRVAHLLSHRTGPVALMSFNPATLAELALVAPQWPRGYLCEGWRRGRRPLLPWARRAALRDFLSETNAPSDFIACEIGALASFGRPAADELGAPLIGWTVRTRSQLERAERLADALIFEHLEPGLVRPSQLALA